METSLDEAMEISDGDAEERSRAAPVLHTEVHRLRKVLAEIAGIVTAEIGTLAAQAMTTEDKLARKEQQIRMVRALAERALGEPLSAERHPMPGAGPQFNGT